MDHPQVGAVHNVIHGSKVGFDIELFVWRYCGWSQRCGGIEPSAARYLG